MLLEKHNFLRIPEVSDFSDWLSEMSDKLRVEQNQKSRFVENEIETNCVGFQEILDTYHWKSSERPFSKNLPPKLDNQRSLGAIRL